MSSRAEANGLHVEHITVRFGGVVAVDDVSLHAPMATITGLIGPNGAGKTTTFNACSGLNRPTAGAITLFGHDITHASPSHRARYGLGRTFQRMELFDSLSVLDNVSLGHEAGLAGGRPWRHIRGSRHDRELVGRAARDAIHLCGIEALVDARPADLSTGQRRLVELARTVAGGFELLLLDEPSSGLDVGETERFGALLRKLVDSQGIGLLIVEHDMALVMSLCDHLYTLDFGKLIFEGSPANTASSPVVRAAYLGDELGIGPDREALADA